MADFADLALRCGFSTAAMLVPLHLECQPSLRAFCNPKQCPNFAANWVCPPGCGPLDACRAKAQAFERGLLVQSVTALSPPTSLATYRRLQREHNLRLRDLVEAVRPQVDALLPLTTGGCIFCEVCSYPAPCVKPDVKMESLSAFGVDVGALCARAGLPFAFRDDVVYYTALLLVAAKANTIETTTSTWAR
jgi:predicted metal-binding protein